MPSADLFLELLEGKDLVSATVVEAARHHVEHSPLPHDAVHISLWLVQGQHITAAQAERLLAAVMEKEASAPNPIPPIGRQPKASVPPQPEEPPARPGPVSSPRKPPPGHGPAAQAAADDLELAPLDDDARAKSPHLKPVQSGPAGKTAAGMPSRSGPPDKGPGKKEPQVAKIGDELDSLESSALKSPLDALIDSEGLGAADFDSAAGLEIGPPRSRKFSIRRLVKRLFRGSKSQVVRVEVADPKKVRVILISWIVGAVLIVGALSAFWVFSPPGANELLDKAQQAVAQNDEGQAIRLYDEFLKQYPKAANANDVRVLSCFAEMRVAEKKAEACGDWAAAFETATAQVKALPATYSDADEVQARLGIALGKIGEGLAQQAQEHVDAASIGRVQALVDLLEAAVPDRNRPEKMLDEIRDTMKHGKQQVESGRELAQTVEAIRAAAAAGDVETAYGAYRDTVRLYPDLAGNLGLAAAMKLVSAAQQKAVKLLPQSLAAANKEQPSELMAALPLAVQPVKGHRDEARGKRFFVVEQGTAYGLDAETGNVLWRRYVVLDSKSSIVTALAIAGPAASDMVVCDPSRQELLRLKGDTGELVWRLAVGQPIVAPPVRAGKWLLLMATDRRLMLVDVATGDSPYYFQLPQAVRLPPVVDTAHGLIYLTADTSNLFVLDINQCRQVMHVGHSGGTIAAPPAVAGDFLLLPVNDQAGEATIRVFAISTTKDADPLTPVQAMTVTGYVDASPLPLGRGAAVVTAEGSLFAFDRTEAGGKLPFHEVASNVAGRRERTTHYSASEAGVLWVADPRPTRYVVRADEHRLVPQTMGEPGMNVVRPLMIESGVMYQVFRKPGMPGMTISAYDLERKDSAWQTWLAARLVAEPVLGAASGQLTAVTASGGFFRAKPAELQRLMKPWEPFLAVEVSRLRKPLVSMLPLSGERFALTSGADTRQIAIYDPAEEQKRFRWLLSPREMSMAPGSLAGGVLAIGVNSEVFLLDPEARGDMAKPLIPSLNGLATSEWQSLAIVEDKLAVLCDGERRLMAVGISSDDGKALKEDGAVTLKTSIVSPVAALGKTVFIADSADNLLGYALPGLTPGKAVPLGSRCAWGPKRAGKLVLLATEKHRLYAFDEQARVVWQSGLGELSLVGAPYAVGDEIYLSSPEGTVRRVSAADGKELGKVDAGCPLASGPLLVGSRLFVGGHDGSILELKKP